MNIVKHLLLFFLVCFFGHQSLIAQFKIADKHQVISIVYDIENSELDSISANLLARDINAVTDKYPMVFNSMDNVKGNVIVIGDINSDLINSQINTSDLNGRYEQYKRVLVKKPTKGIDQAMFIIGSDPRGAAYGVFDLSKEIGVSPWYWWADVPVEKKTELSVSVKDTLSSAPSVKFRGVFINDEGWGLEPWASKSFEPSVGNLGPKTYAKIFELLLRLKGNTIWPGMHPNTQPFFTVPGNQKTADKWEIVVSTSHAEPMLRNNVGEWNSDTMGRFNYQTNASSVYNYWEDRIKESKDVDAIYTLGMRGVHDSGMEGFSSIGEKVNGLEKIIADQRELLKKYIHKDVSEVPQSFTAYKEVLELYENGLKLPEDITLVWPDDNYGHIKRFSNSEEQQRSGGSGVYYHLSYLGAPHPYIWLSPMSPALIWREMNRASVKNMNEIWIANVGDLKRREWQTEFFMDLAWDTNNWNPENIKDYFKIIASRDISQKHGEQIGDIMWEYYRLANERKPEFMGFNKPQWNGWTPVGDPLLSLWNYGDETQKRINRYQELQNQALEIMGEIPSESKDAYFQLVYYPVAAATAMNKKWLYAYKSREYAKQGRAVANALSDSAFAAFESIKKLSDHFNYKVSNGKWEHLIDYSPSYKKGSLVFWEPITKRIQTDGLKGFGVAIEGQTAPLKPDGILQPKVSTAESTIKIKVSEAKITGEMIKSSDSNGEFLMWPENGNNSLVEEPNWDKIPFEIESPAKAEFEFEFSDHPGGVHTLNLSVFHPDEGSDSWWVTLNDQPPLKVGDSVGRLEQLKAFNVVLKPGKNKLIVQPREDGAQLYGIEFVQESQQFSAYYSDSTSLPMFDRYTEQSHFIDIYSWGSEKEQWSAKTSAPWIQLSDRKGTLYRDQDRIWVSVNYDKAPSDKSIQGFVEITSGKQSYRVLVSAANSTTSLDGDFVETNGVIAMKANQFSKKTVGKVASWQPLAGLGRSGSAMLLQPMEGWYMDDLSKVRQESPVMEYEIVVTKGGDAEVIVEAVPAFPLNPGEKLRCAVSVEDQELKWIDFEMNGQKWNDNVLESRMIGTTRLNMEPGTYHLKIWGTDPSVNIDRILIDFGKLKKSYSGPDSTLILGN